MGYPPPNRRSRLAPHERHRAGLTLVELMVVALTIAVLGAGALPRFHSHVFRSKRTEAIYGLRTIHDLQLDYYARNGEYSDSFLVLGKPLEAGEIHQDGSYRARDYTFTLATWDVDGRPNANYRATATADLDPSDAALDIVVIENDLTVHE